MREGMAFIGVGHILPHFRVKGSPHMISHVLKATQLISVHLGLPDSLA